MIQQIRMVDVYDQLVKAVVDSDRAAVRRIVEGGIDLNARVDQGASILFGAILYGDDEIIRILLEHGADPNFVADEPAATLYTEKPLDLARQARFLWDWDKYDPIVKLLESFGATDFEGQVESESHAKLRESRAREYQSQRSAQVS
jgi:hypothetical protein